MAPDATSSAAPASPAIPGPDRRGTDAHIVLPITLSNVPSGLAVQRPGNGLAAA